MLRGTLWAPTCSNGFVPSWLWEAVPLGSCSVFSRLSCGSSEFYPAQ